MADDDMRKGAARWMDAAYDTENNGGAPKMTLEAAIKKLFENVLDNEDEAVITPDAENRFKLGRTAKTTEWTEWNHEEIGEKSRFHVIRGKSA